MLLTLFPVVKIVTATTPSPTGGTAATSAGTTLGSSSTDDSKFSKEELTKILAPVALYPDQLLAQMFMAATYPLEIILADRFMKETENAKLTGDALDKKLESQTWDESVKSLCQFKTTLSTMGEKVEETKKLGDAFLAQQEEVMAVVQELRAKAVAAGNLKSSEQLKVEEKTEEQKQVIVVTSANPEVIYVPTYNPYYVYGSWWYATPPYYWYAPAPTPLLTFTAAVFVASAWHGWCGFRWGHGHVHIHHHHHRHYHGGAHISGRVRVSGGSWAHNPSHRGGVSYRGSVTRTKYSNGATRTVQRQAAARGHSVSKVSTNRISNNSFSGVSNGSAARRSSTRGTASTNRTTVNRSTSSYSRSSASRSYSRPSGGMRSGGGGRRR